ncbi:hypothetical protein AKJ16_DCAP19414 [Drosera capensis]
MKFECANIYGVDYASFRRRISRPLVRILRSRRRRTKKGKLRFVKANMSGNGHNKGKQRQPKVRRDE